MAASRPNIVLVVVDQWRADCLSAAGHPVVETPVLDALFETGTRFTNAYASVPSCIAARASLLTGAAQRNHGRVGYQDRVPWTYGTTIGSVFTAAGYQTHVVGKMHVFPARRRMGFEEVELHDGYLEAVRRRPVDLTADDDYLAWLRAQAGAAADIIDSGLGCNGYTVRPWLAPDRLHPTSWVVTQGIDFLGRRDPGNPFLLKLSFHRPHPPLDPPGWLLDRYAGRELPELPEGDWAGGMQAFNLAPVEVTPTSPLEVHRARAAYFAQISFIDLELNRFLHALDEHGLTGDTAIVFLSDHGEMLYDHGRVGKVVPYEGSIRVPFQLRLPPAQGPHPVRTSDAVVELRDVLPTLCDVASIDVPATVDGTSVAGLARSSSGTGGAGGAGGSGWRPYLHGEHNVWGLADHHWVTDGHEKYVWFSGDGREQFFDLDADPKELHEVAATRPDRVEHWRRALIAELHGREEAYVVDGQLVTGRPTTAVLTRAPLLLEGETDAAGD